MILEAYIIIQCLAVIFFIISLFKRIILTWVISLVLFGAQIMSSFSIENYIYTITSSGTVISNTFIYSYPEIAYVNMLFFAVTLIMGIGDMILNKTAGHQLA